MTEERNIQRALMLYQQQRFSEAEKEFGNLIASEPANGYFHSMAALCFAQQGKFGEAEMHAANGIGLNPSDPFSYYTASITAFNVEKFSEAEKHISTAISLNPGEADYHELKSMLLMEKKEWQLAFEAANTGLSFQSDHMGCLNCRAKAQVKLNDKEAAYQTIKEALYFDPENAQTHANLGWGLLEKGDHKKALHHFRQAMMLDPNNRYAKSGIVEALKARYWFYRLFLRYAFWIGNMKGGTQWGVIIGFYIGSRLINGLGKAVPALQVITVPIIVLYSVFALTTWIIAPLSNLFLRLNVYGRYALDREEIVCSNIIGISLLISLLSGISYFIFPSPLFIMLSVLAFSMTVPLSAAFSTPKHRRGRLLLMLYSGAMLLTGFAAIAAYLITGNNFNLFCMIYFAEFIVFQWAGNAIAIK